MTEIATPRLLLRTPTPSDLDAFYAVFSDPEAMRYIPNGPVSDRERVARGVARRIDMEARVGYTLWAVERHEDGAVLGDCGLWPVEGTGPEVEVAYHLAKRYWGMGYATEAASAVVRHGLDALGLERIIGITFPEHTRSQRVLLKAGLREIAPRTYYDREMKVFEIER